MLRKRRWPPGVRIEVRCPLSSQLRTVPTVTPKHLATSPIAMSAGGVVVAMTMDGSYNYANMSNLAVSGVLYTGKLTLVDNSRFM